MILTFNKTAAKDVGKRVTRDFGISHFDNARTFHSLAHRLVNPGKKFLFDDGDGEFDDKAQSWFIEEIVKELMDDAFKAVMYAHLRRELNELEQREAQIRTQDYFVFLRNLRQISLRGYHVKSKGEKVIADFLFEHDIKHKYEAHVGYWVKRANVVSSGHNPLCKGE